MAKKTLQVNINEPCHEDWNKMTATQCGAFCKSCQKEVIDFTNKSEAQIVEILSQAKGKVCGRFTADKLNTPLSQYTPDPEWYSWKKWAVAASVLFGAGSLNADTNSATADINSTPADTTARKDTPLVQPPLVGMIAIIPLDTPTPATPVCETITGDTIYIAVDTTAVIDEPIMKGEVDFVRPRLIMGKVDMSQQRDKAPRKKP